MTHIWELFENLDEVVYATDIDTNEVVYMNAHMRNLLGIQTKDGYLGKKCYSLIQGKHSPCEFCTNSRLEEGKFHSWIQTNPVLKKTVNMKDTLICKDGRRYRLKLAVDMDEHKMNAEDYLYTRTESILNTCIQKFFSEDG